ncbi:MAG: NIPSNAP family protein [Planctomycetes bacterium]|nr:NIPSNAP family protein [Planctomycetota bacterium]
MVRFFLSLVFFMSVGSQVMSQDNKVYELRTYTSEAGRQADTLKLISSEGVSFMKKHKIDLVGVWTPVDTADERVFMLVSHADKSSGTANWTAFQGDESWKAAVKKSEVDGKKPVKGIEQIFLTANDYSPKLEVKDIGNRIFELRTYIASPKNLAALNNRFRNHTLKLFTKHGMTNIVYWSVRDGEATTCSQLLQALSPAGNANAKLDGDPAAAGNALVYFIAHASPEAAKASFGKFRDDADWQKALKESEANAGGPLTAQGGVKSLYLKPVAFSPLK